MKTQVRVIIECGSREVTEMFTYSNRFIRFRLDHPELVGWAEQLFSNLILGQCGE